MEADKCAASAYAHNTRLVPSLAILKIQGLIRVEELT